MGKKESNPSPEEMGAVKPPPPPAPPHKMGMTFYDHYTLLDFDPEKYLRAIKKRKNEKCSSAN